MAKNYLTKEEMDALHTRLFDRMVERGWLLRYTLTKGKGFHLTWLKKGAMASVLLKNWGLALRIPDGDNYAFIVTELAHGSYFDPRSAPNPIRAVLASLKAAGFAHRAEWISGIGIDIHWTSDGEDFKTALCELVDDLGLRGDEDGLLCLFSIADGWAPDPKAGA